MASALVLSYLVLLSCCLPAWTTMPDTTDVLVEDDWPLVRSYRLEDFLWSGSGDGASDAPTSPWVTTTVFRTTTVLATIYTTPVYYGSGDEQPQPSPVWPQPTGVISPTPTLKPTLSTTFFPTATENSSQTDTPDQRYWLLTVLIANNSLLGDTVGLEARLAHIYKIAFSRHQEYHLGLGNKTVQKNVPSRYRRAQQSLSVHVHNMTVRGEREVEVVYSVRVAGQPIPALTAADDMRLVSTAEVESELGYQVLTKAEPYLKTNLPLNGGSRLARGRDTWLLVGAAVSAVCLLLLLVALVALALGKRKRHPVASNRQQVFQREQEGGVANLGYEEEGPGTKNKSSSLKSSSFQQATVTFQEDSRRLSSGSSGSSSQVSLVRRRPTQGHIRRGGRRGTHGVKGGRAKEHTDEEDKPKPKPRRRHHIHGSSKQSKSDLEAGLQQDDQEGSGDDLVDHMTTTEEGGGGGPTVSPNSLLSMPSVKSFPRGANIPEPLARVLEPVNVTQNETEGLVIQPQRVGVRPAKLSRHGSVEGEDPGVVGPLVWDLHCQHLLYQQQQITKHTGTTVGTEKEDDVDDLEARSPDASATNIGRMRRRFNELLDDAFSLFGSRSVSPDDSSSPPLTGTGAHRVHSAIVRPVGEPFNFDLTPRPRTTGCRPATAAPSVSRPRGAWATKEPSIGSAFSGTLARPLSAGPFHRPQLTLAGEPIIERELVLNDSRLPPTDPAVPLIAAIKEELRKFQDPQPTTTLPGEATPTSKS